MALNARNSSAFSLSLFFKCGHFKSQSLQLWTVFESDTCTLIFAHFAASKVLGLIQAEITENNLEGFPEVFVPVRINKKVYASIQVGEEYGDFDDDEWHVTTAITTHLYTINEDDRHD